MSNRKRKIEKTKHFVGSKSPTGWERYGGGSAVSPREIQSAYLGESKFGNAMVQSIIDIRTNFIIGQGMNIYTEGENERELEIINEVLDKNDILSYLDQYVVQTEIEGRLLAVFGDNLDITIFPWMKYTYEVVESDEKPGEIEYIRYTDYKGQKVEINPEDFIYRNFGSSLWYLPSKANTRMMSVMEYINNLERVRLDIRKVNHLFASPTPLFKTESQEETVALHQELVDKNWTIGKVLITTADYSLVEMNKDSVQCLIDEINMLSETISGVTGVPIYFLGITRPLQSRAAALAMLEQLENSVQKERSILTEFFNDLFVHILANHEQSDRLDVHSVKCKFIKPAILDVDERIIERLFTLYSNKALSLKSLLSFVPEIEDVDEEIKRIGDIDDE